MNIDKTSIVGTHDELAFNSNSDNVFGKNGDEPFDDKAEIFFQNDFNDIPSLEGWLATGPVVGAVEAYSDNEIEGGVEFEEDYLEDDHISGM